MKKVYAVKKGRKTGIFNTWSECKENVDGFSGAIYKSFTNICDAKKFMNDNNEVESTSILKDKSEMTAYIDGSYDDSLKRYGYGVIIFLNNKKIVFSKSYNDSKCLKLRNVAGELKAAMKVMEYAKENNIKSMDIYYDYIGIEMWALGSWKTNLEFTRAYAEYAKNIMKDIKINFNKVKAHTGNKYNEEVDKIAKNSLIDL